MMSSGHNAVPIMHKNNYLVKFHSCFFRSILDSTSTKIGYREMELQPASLSNISTSSLSSNPLAETSEQIASGSRINRASDNPAGIQVSISLSRDINENAAGLRNVMDGTSLTQTALGGISQVTDSVTQLRELSLQAQNGTLNDSDRQALQEQADQLLAGIKDTIDQTSFNGRSLLSEEGTVGIQAGNSRTDINTPDLLSTLADENLFSLDISSPDALQSLDNSLDLLNQSAGSFAISQNRLESTANSLTDASINAASSRSQISDTDTAQAISEQSLALIQREVAISMQAQANAERSDVLALLG